MRGVPRGSAVQEGLIGNAVKVGQIVSSRTRKQRYSCCGIVRATHFMRTTPITLWTKQAEQFDAKVRDTVFQILGLQQTPEAYDQISVSTTIGGLGIRRVLDHAKGAFTASWHEARGITKEYWTIPCFLDCSGVYQTQHKASENVDTAIMEKLKAGANKRDTQRLNRLDLPHANAWLTAR